MNRGYCMYSGELMDNSFNYYEKMLQYNYDLMELNDYHSEIVEEILNRWLLMFLEGELNEK